MSTCFFHQTKFTWVFPLQNYSKKQLFSGLHQLFRREGKITGWEKKSPAFLRRKRVSLTNSECDSSNRCFLSHSHSFNRSLIQTQFPYSYVHPFLSYFLSHFFHISLEKNTVFSLFFTNNVRADDFLLMQCWNIFFYFNLFTDWLYYTTSVFIDFFYQF